MCEIDLFSSMGFLLHLNNLYSLLGFFFPQEQHRYFPNLNFEAFLASQLNTYFTLGKWKQQPPQQQLGFYRVKPC